MKMAAKKNRVNVYGKMFHMTPSGKLLPLGAKQNPFTRCMSDALKGNMVTGKNLTEVQKQSNKDLFADAVSGCKPKKTPVKRAPAKK